MNNTIQPKRRILNRVMPNSYKPICLWENFQFPFCIYERAGGGVYMDS